MITPLFANRWLIALPPIWLVGMGALLASLVLVVLWGASSTDRTASSS